MRLDPRLEQWRKSVFFLPSKPGDPFGCFNVPGPHHEVLTIVASCGNRETGVLWEHVSVSTRKHVPTWAEMCFAKDLFWDHEETVMQLHPPRSRWVNNHPRCLHLWRPLGIEIPLPPDETVGIRDAGKIVK
jgi:hypothetical protein